MSSTATASTDVEAAAESRNTAKTTLQTWTMAAASCDGDDDDDDDGAGGRMLTDDRKLGARTVKTARKIGTS